VFSSPKTSYALATLPPLAIALLISHYGVNLPLMDHWDGFFPIFESWKSGTFELNSLWALHNEHRPAVPRAVMLATTFLGDWNIVRELYLSVAVQCCTLIILLSLFRLSIKHLPEDQNFNYFPVLSSLLLFSMCQHENWIWSWQLSIFLCTAFSALAFWAIIRWERKAVGLLLSFVAAVLASYSFACGLALFPLLLFFVFKYHPTRLSLFGWILGSIAVVYCYTLNFSSGQALDLAELMSPNQLFKISMFIFAYIGAPLGTLEEGLEPESFKRNLAYAIIIGGAAVLFSLVLLKKLYKHSSDLKVAVLPWVGLQFFVVLCAGVSALGRVHIGVGQALASRYTTISILFWIGLLALVLMYSSVYFSEKTTKNSRRLLVKAAVFSVMTILYLAPWIRGVMFFQEHASQLEKSRIEIRQLEGACSDESIKVVYSSAAIFRTIIPRARALSAPPFDEIVAVNLNR